MMDLTIVFTVLGQHDMAHSAIEMASRNISLSKTKIVVIDNGGDFALGIDNPRVLIHRPEKNLGVYPVFDYAFNFEYVTGGVVAFLHSDLFINEFGFDARILRAFDSTRHLGLIGFVGSNEIDAAGGRGGGTTSNFQGLTYHTDGGGVIVANKIVGNSLQHWTGSPAEAHGMRNAEYTNAAVVDGCAMVISREAWRKIGNRENFPPHHFYDKLISTQMLEAGYKVGVLGIACDHLGGQTVSREEGYNNLAEEWSREHLRPDQWIGNVPNFSWDQTVYHEAERQWLTEYRDTKHIVPLRV